MLFLNSYTGKVFLASVWQGHNPERAFETADTLTGVNVTMQL